MDTLDEQFTELLRTQFDAPADTAAESRYDDMELDSLVLVEIAVTLSQRYDVHVTDSEIHEIGTVGGTVDLLRAKGVPG